MTTLSLDAFIGKESGPENKPMFLLMYELDEAYEAKYGYYIYEDDTLEPLSEWLRNAGYGRDLLLRECAGLPLLRGQSVHNAKRFGGSDTRCCSLHFILPGRRLTL